MITEACRYARINGPGCVQLEKPKITIKKLTPEKEEQIESFFQDKANVIMSSYKTDSATGLPVHYLKNTKKALWERFHEEYPDGIKRTTFYKYLQGEQYIYKENLGGLCSICNMYGYESFDELQKLILHYASLDHQVNLIFDNNDYTTYSRYSEIIRLRKNLHVKKKNTVIVHCLKKFTNSYVCPDQ